MAQSVMFGMGRGQGHWHPCFIGDDGQLIIVSLAFATAPRNGSFQTLTRFSLTGAPGIGRGFSTSEMA